MKLETKRGMKKWIAAAALAVVVAALACALLWRGGDVLVRIGDQRITSAEYYVYLYEIKMLFESRGDEDIWETDFGESGTSEDVAKNNALTSLELIKISAQEAKRLGITLTAEEKTAAAFTAEKTLEDIGAERAERLGITAALTRRVVEEGVLYQKYYGLVTEDAEEGTAGQVFMQAYDEAAKDVEIIRNREAWDAISVRDLE